MSTTQPMHEIGTDGRCMRCGRSVTGNPGAAATLCWGKPASRAPIERSTIGETDERSNQRGDSR